MTKPKTAAKPRKPKQNHFAGMEPPSVPEIDDLAAEFLSVANEVKRLKLEKDGLGDKLLILMGRHKLFAYKTPDGKMVSLEAGKQKVTVKGSSVTVTDAEENDED
jgi:hypothetical protein